MNSREQQELQKVLNTLNKYVPVTSREDVDAKLGCMLTIKSLIDGQFAKEADTKDG